jgi:hypothetical protein
MAHATGEGMLGIDRGQAEAARTHVKLNFFLVGVPAFEVGSNFVDQYWFVAHVETAGLVRVMTVLAPPANRRKAGAPRKTTRRRFSRMCLGTEARRASNFAVHDRP